MFNNHWFKYHFPFVLWMGIIFTQSSFPSVDLPKIELIGFDKLLHFAVYGLLGILCFLSIIHQSKITNFVKKPYIWSVIIVSFYGLTDEFHQYFVSNRSCEFQDWLADFIGAILGVMIVRFVLQKYIKQFTIE